MSSPNQTLGQTFPVTTTYNRIRYSARSNTLCVITCASIKPFDRTRSAALSSWNGRAAPVPGTCSPAGPGGLRQRPGRGPRPRPPPGSWPAGIPQRWRGNEVQPKQRLGRARALLRSLPVLEESLRYQKNKQTPVYKLLI